MTSDVAAIIENVALTTYSGRRTVHNYVLETLRRAILDGQLTSGTRLVQSEIAEALDVSTTPVREALRDLAAEGLIRLDAHRGGVVQELSLSELREIYELRVLLEPEALRRAWPHVTNEIVDEVAELHERMNKTQSPSDWVELNSSFHGRILELAPSPRLLLILDGLVAPWVMYVSASLMADPENQKRAAEGHDHVLAALRERDLDAAIAASVEHLGITWRTLAASLQQQVPL